MAHQSGPETVYYRGTDIMVTSQRVDTRHGRFLVPDLDHIYREYEETLLPRKVALFCGALELVLAAPLAVAYGAIVLLCAGLLAAGGLGVAAAIESRNKPAWMVLTAKCRGRVVILYSGHDALEFGKVHRAVLRAVEANEVPERRSGTDLMVAAGQRGRSAASRALPRRSGRR